MFYIIIHQIKYMIMFVYPRPHARTPARTLKTLHEIEICPRLIPSVRTPARPHDVNW